MNYVQPVQSVIPGVQGRVLSVLAGTTLPLTIRKTARLAGVSVNRAADVVIRLEDLGLIERWEAGPAAQIKLVRENEAARAVIALARLTGRVVERLREEAEAIEPPPASLVIFGSFATGGADEISDLDVLAVGPPGVTIWNSDEYLDSLTRWTDRARRIVGNPVNVLHTSIEELPEQLARRPSVWDDAATYGMLLRGTELRQLGGAR